MSKIVSSQKGAQIAAELGKKEITGLINIRGFTKHGINQTIERGVKPQSILDDIKNPLKICKIKIDSMGRASKRFIGQKAEIVINPNTKQIVSVNPTTSNKAEKLISRIHEKNNIKQ